MDDVPAGLTPLSELRILACGMSTDEREELLRKVESLRNILGSRATGQGGDEQFYVQLRRDLIADRVLGKKLPCFVHSCRTLGDFWSHIKPLFGKYEERRRYLREEFAPVLGYLEGRASSPSDDTTTQGLKNVDWDHVQAAWQKALDRRDGDPEGAITAARTLLETVCKHILDEHRVAYDPQVELPKLYAETARQLSLAPSQHQEQIFKQILGGCQSVVEGLGALRNKLSDAHGHGKTGTKPAPRHAELAVNLAGTMATFLIATAQQKKGTT